MTRPEFGMERGAAHGQIKAVPRLRSHGESESRYLPVVQSEQAHPEIPPAPPAHRALGTRYSSVRGHQCPRYHSGDGRQGSLHPHRLNQLPGDEFRTVGEDIAAFMRDAPTDFSCGACGRGSPQGTGEFRLPPIPISGGAARKAQTFLRLLSPRSRHCSTLLLSPRGCLCFERNTEFIEGEEAV